MITEVTSGIIQAVRF